MARSSTTLKPGERPQGAGRPRGSKSIYSKESVKKLEELGYDPIEEMIRTQDELKELVEQEKLKKRPSMVAIATWYNTIQKISSDLMRYGYGRTPEPQNDAIAGDEGKSITIKLN